jgi:uncharacterized protein
MSKKIHVTLDFEQDVESYLKESYPELKDFHILHKALDARGSNRGVRPKIHYDLDIICGDENFAQKEETFFDLKTAFDQRFNHPPLIIGMGPAGLFCALRFAEYGIPCLLFERGGPANKRMLAIARSWRYGEMDENNNVCFGEGGAGLFSDGKLITRVKSPFIQYVMNKFVEFGAPPEVAYTANPHLGSNRIRALITVLTDTLKKAGHQFHYHTPIAELLYAEGAEKKVIGVQTSDGKKYYSDHIILAMGHSADEFYEHLSRKKVDMKLKDFALGMRVEHPRRLIDRLQYGDFCASEELGASRYRLSFHDTLTDRGTYSFCMCPGGHVLSSGTRKEGLVVNGMSNYARSSPWSNSALVVSVKNEQDCTLTGQTHIMQGLNFIRKIEENAYEQSLSERTGKEIPSIRLGDFLNEKVSSTELPKTSCPSGIFPGKMDQIFPSFVLDQLRQGLMKFDQQIKGFIAKEALLLAPETRTSSPISITRDREDFVSTSHRGLYPCGEGAGHAGGITSAAVDGVKVCEAILRSLK